MIFRHSISLVFIFSFMIVLRQNPIRKLHILLFGITFDLKNIVDINKNLVFIDDISTVKSFSIISSIHSNHHFIHFIIIFFQLHEMLLRLILVKITLNKRSEQHKFIYRIHQLLLLLLCNFNNYIEKWSSVFISSKLL